MKLVFQRDKTVELLDAVVRGVKDQSVVIRHQAQDKTADQGRGVDSFGVDQDVVRQHGRRLLIAQCLAGQFHVAQPFEVLAGQPVDFAKVVPESGGLQGLGEKKWSGGCGHRRVSFGAPMSAPVGRVSSLKNLEWLKVVDSYYPVVRRL